MKTILLMLVFSFNLAIAADYESGMQKGLEMFNKAKSVEETMEVTNYFDRIASAFSNEWLPLYYAAYGCLRTGFQQESADKKDEWYQKGLAYLERCRDLKSDESELLSMKAYLKLMYISNKPMVRAPSQTEEAQEMLEKAKKLNPSNPRPWFVQGQNTLFTPKFFGGGSENAKPLLEKAYALYNSFEPADALMPDWGREHCKALLDKCKE